MFLQVLKFLMGRNLTECISGSILAGILTQIFIEKSLQTLLSDTIYLDEWGIVSRNMFVKNYPKLCERKAMGYWIELVTVPSFFSLLTVIKVTKNKLRNGITVLTTTFILNMSVSDFGYYAVLCTSQGTNYNFFLEGINPANLCVAITLLILGLAPIIITFTFICSNPKRRTTEGFIARTSVPEHIHISPDSPGSERWATSRYPGPGQSPWDNLG